ncbi:hypothetical protein D9M71_279650 [compost metagenome]
MEALLARRDAHPLQHRAGLRQQVVLLREPLGGQHVVEVRPLAGLTTVRWRPQPHRLAAELVESQHAAPALVATENQADIDHMARKTAALRAPQQQSPPLVSGRLHHRHHLAADRIQPLGDMQIVPVRPLVLASCIEHRHHELPAQNDRRVLGLLHAGVPWSYLVGARCLPVIVGAEDQRPARVLITHGLAYRQQVTGVEGHANGQRSGHVQADARCVTLGDQDRLAWLGVRADHAPGALLLHAKGPILLVAAGASLALGVDDLQTNNTGLRGLHRHQQRPLAAIAHIDAHDLLAIQIRAAPFLRQALPHRCSTPCRLPRRLLRVLGSPPLGILLPGTHQLALFGGQLGALDLQLLRYSRTPVTERAEVQSDALLRCIAVQHIPASLLAHTVVGSLAAGQLAEYPGRVALAEGLQPIVVQLSENIIQSLISH